MMTNRAARTAGFLAAALWLAGPVAAQETVAQDAVALGPHQVTVTESADFNRLLSVDGQVLHENGLILLDGAVEVAGETVVTGIAGAGGNACNATPIVVSLRDGAPRLDGPVDSCSWFERRVEADRIVFYTEALPGMDAEIWHWTPADGLVAEGTVAFTPDTAEGWEGLADLKDAHPLDALAFAPVYEQLKSGLSAEDWAVYSDILGQLGSGELVPEGYRGQACNKYVCEDEWAMLWIDSASRTAVALWKRESDEEPKSFPADPATWPEWIGLDASAALGGAG